MIWFTLALFAVSFVLTALLAPTPDIENARPESLDPENFPRATEDAPVPLVLGCARVKGPNTLYYGDFRSEPVTEKIKVNIFKSKRITVGYKYYLTMDMGICLGPGGRLKKIWIDSEEVVSGDQIEAQTFDDIYNDTFTIGGGTNIAYKDVGVKGTVEAALGYTITDEELDAILAQGLVKIEGTIEYTTIKEIEANQPAYSQSDMVFTLYSDKANDQRIPPSDGTGFKDDGSTYYDTQDGVEGTATLRIEPSVVLPGTRTISVGSRILPFFTLVNTYEVSENNFIITYAGEDISSQNFDIYAPELYGGEKSGGGHIGNVTFYNGAFDQAVDPDIEASAGVGNVPAYRGMMHLAMPDQYIGESPQLRAIEFLIGKYSDLLELGNEGKVGNTPDINPAEAIYYCMVSEWAGLSVPENQIDKESFYEAGLVLESELNGCSINVSTTKDGKSIINEVLRQIDGVLVQNDNNLVALKLIRNDYDPDDLVTYDENDIIEVSGYTKSSWEDVKSRIKLSFASRDKDSTLVAEAQNMATMGMIGRINSTQISMPFCYDPDLANRLAHRELAQLSTPLLRMTLKMNRNGFKIRTGDVFKIDWSEYGISDLVLRAQKVDLGELNSNIVEIEVVQDIFAINTVVFGPPETTGWTNSRPSPETEVTSQIVEMPRFFQNKLEEPISDGFGSVIPFALQPAELSNSFDFLSGVTDGSLDIRDLSGVVYPLSGTMVADYDRFEGVETGVDATGFTITDVTGNLNNPPSNNSAGNIPTGDGGLLYINGEWMAHEGVTDNEDGTYTLENIHRGLLGTTVTTHLAEDRIYFFETDLLDVSTIGAELGEEDTIYFKTLDRIGATPAAPEDVTQEEFTLAALADRPLRPRNLELGGSRTPPITIGGNTDATWVASNRESAVIPAETDAAEVPDQAETYNVEVYINGELDAALSSDGETSPYTIPFGDLSTVTGGPNNEVRVYAVRTVGDLRVSSGYATIPFELAADDLLLSGDEQSGTDKVLFSGDEQSGTDIEELSGDEA